MMSKQIAFDDYAPIEPVRITRNPSERLKRIREATDEAMNLLRISFSDGKATPGDLYMMMEAMWDELRVFEEETLQDSVR